MSSGTLIALTTVRVPHGDPRPSEETFRKAIESDRTALGLHASDERTDLAIAGPYPITIDQKEIDEYVVWER